MIDAPDVWDGSLDADEEPEHEDEWWDEESNRCAPVSVRPASIRAEEMLW